MATVARLPQGKCQAWWQENQSNCPTTFCWCVMANSLSKIRLFCSLLFSNSVYNSLQKSLSQAMRVLCCFISLNAKVTTEDDEIENLIKVELDQPGRTVRQKIFWLITSVSIYHKSFLCFSQQNCNWPVGSVTNAETCNELDLWKLYHELKFGEHQGKHVTYKREWDNPRITICNWKQWSCER